ncbi:hypothetical protein ACVWWO_007947 [Bradyrhizobium sp. F1.13.1]
MLAKRPAQQLLRAQIVQFDAAAACEPVSVADHKLEALGEQRPDIEPLPGLVDVGGNPELGLALLQQVGHFTTRAAQEAEFEPVELPFDLVEMRDEERKIDRMRQRDAKRADLAAAERGGQRACAGGRIKTLLQQRMHALAELGQLRRRPFAAKQIAAEFGLELLDRARQRRLRHVAVLGGTREVQELRHREEIADLMHFHWIGSPARPGGG